MEVKTELVVPAGSLEEMIRLLDAGADAVQIGEQRYGMRLPGDIEAGLMQEAAEIVRKRSAKLYVVMNNLLDQSVLSELPDYIRRVAAAGADAIVFGDPALLVAAREANVKIPFHWNPEMTATNWLTANYWGTKGAVRAILARELNMEQVLEFKRNANVEVQVQVHGITNIFHSKRRMVANYYEHLGKKYAASDSALERQMFLIEEERQDERYPIYEDSNGTHIMSSDDLCMIENLHELLEGGIDSFKIETLMKPVDYNETVVRAYRSAIDAYAANPQEYRFQAEWLEAIERVQPQDRLLSYGFFYKEQVY